ncbi:MAG TPA: hypothetical protein VG271_09825 [Beijerinckiaceae bacterium]|jgi:hypothetical protein|nr:hypothetical protein [Beijerinckiaceae bacterium]
MHRISFVLAGLLVVAAASSDTAFAAITASRAAITQGEAINECRQLTDPTSDNHHARPARIACVQRMLHADQKSAW